MVIHICIANSNAQKYSTTIVSYIAMLLFALKIIIQKRYKLQEIIMIAFSLFWGFCSYRVADDMRVLWFAIVLCASKDIEFDKVVNYSFKAMLFCCISFMLLFKMGLIEETKVYSIRGIRHSYGLGHPNMCSAYYALLMIQYVYLHFKKIKAVHLIVLIIGSFIVYYLTKSTTGLITMLTVIMIIFALKYMPFKKMNSKIIVIGLIVGVTLFTVIPIIYDGKFTIIDTLMSGRLHQANFYYEKYGVSLFGNNINADLNSIYTDNILDMGYAKMLINNGLIYYLIVVFGYIVSMIKACESGRRDLVALFACFIVYMFTENVATYIFMNVTMLLFSDFLYKKRNFKKEVLEL